MTTATLQSTVGQLVRERPARARLFEHLNIDYCCGGKIPLAEACAKRDLDPNDVFSRLCDLDAMLDAPGACVDADAMTLTALADHIEQTHHAYLRTELPRLDYLTARVQRAHGDKDARLATVRQALVALRDELLSHMAKEEQILFPIIRQLESAAEQPAFHCGSIANPIRQMELEHDSAGNALAVMHQATDGYAPPDWACNTYRAMLDALAHLEKDMHQHVHKENNVLFPKALARETQLAGAGAR